jgi:hypothetical protein
VPPAAAGQAPYQYSTPPKPPARWPLVVAAVAGSLLTLGIISLLGGDDAPTDKPNDPGRDAGAASAVDPRPDALPRTPADAPPKVPTGSEGVDAGSAEPVRMQVVPVKPKAKPGEKVPIVFSSEPPNAQVWIRMDRRIRMLCTTPCTFDLPAGKQVLVELRRNGYASAQRTFTIAEGERFDGVLPRN